MPEVRAQCERVLVRQSMSVLREVYCRVHWGAEIVAIVDLDLISDATRVAHRIPHKRGSVIRDNRTVIRRDERWRGGTIFMIYSALFTFLLQ